MRTMFLYGALALAGGCTERENTAAVFSRENVSVELPVGKPLWTESAASRIETRPCGRTPCRDQHFSLEIGTNDSFDMVGILWSDDSGVTSSLAEGERLPGRGLWRVSGVSQRPTEDVVYSLYGERSGQRFWEGSTLHLDKGAVATAPVRIQNATLTSLEPRELRYELDVETFSFLSPGSLDVRVEELGKNAPCQKVKEHLWRCEGLIKSTVEISNQVKFVATYIVDKKEFFDIFQVPLRTVGDISLVPRMVNEVGSSFPIAGNLIFQCNMSTYSKNTAMNIDGGQWSSGDFLHVLTSSLSDGTHTVECVGNLGQGALEIHATHSFVVKNPWWNDKKDNLPSTLGGDEQRLSGVLAWAEGEKVLAVFGAARGEKTLVLWDTLHGQVEGRYPLPLGSMATLVTLHGERIAALDADNSMVRIWDAPGTPAHSVLLPPQFRSGRRSLALGEAEIFVASRDTNRLVALDERGGVVASLSLEGAAECSDKDLASVALLVEQRTLWVLCGNCLQGFALVNGRFEMRNSLTLSQRVREPVAMARDSQGRFWIADASPSRVLVVDDQGRLQTAWYGTGRRLGVAGDFGTPSALYLNSTGDFYLGTAFDADTLRFRPLLN